MKYVDEFRNGSLASKLGKEIAAAVSAREFSFMEVCGTHTMAIFRHGLRDLLPKGIRLISGPGCPVCVTSAEYLDRAIAISRLPDVMMTTFADMLRVPGSVSSLEKEKADGRAIAMVYSTEDALDMAVKYPDREIVFLGVGFETTVPTVAASILLAKKRGIKNYSVLCAHKTMPKAMEALVLSRDFAIDGFLLPGHVSAITGIAPYRFLSEEYGKACVVSGFEPADILKSILMLVSQKSPKVEIEYDRIVEPEGNPVAQRMMDEVFAESDAVWRGIGNIRKSGLKIRREYSYFDAGVKFDVKVKSVKENRACICGEVLKGIKTPLDCKLFAKRCVPEDPVGSCMVSSEGTCAAYYKYNRK